MQTMGPNTMRKRSESNNCHQCHRSDKETVVRCTKCKQKNCCTPCITKWMDETAFVEACSVCHYICNCAACLQSDAANKDMPISDLKLSTEDKIQHSKYILRAVLPYLKHFVVEQNMEREDEARIQGLSITGLQLPKENFRDNDQVRCNNCKTCIFDVDRSCLNCFYKLCVICFREIRDGFSLENGKYHVHDEGCNFTTKDRSSRVASGCIDYTKLVFEWKLKEKGTTVCPPEGMGGCGRGNLELKSTSPDNWVSELLMKAEAVAEVGKLTDTLEASEGACSCLRSNQGSKLESAMSCKARSQEESNVNYLHCPTVVDVERPDLKHFQWHLYKGEPVIVPNLLSGTTGLSWEPLVMWCACRKSRKTNHLHIRDLSVLNCFNCCEVISVKTCFWLYDMLETINIHQVSKGYVEGLFDSEGQLKILKLEDWPPAESFKDRLSRHFLELIRCLSFRHYTHPHAGYLNMSAKQWKQLTCTFNSEGRLKILKLEDWPPDGI